MWYCFSWLFMLMQGPENNSNHLKTKSLWYMETKTENLSGSRGSYTRDFRFHSLFLFLIPSSLSVGSVVLCLTSILSMIDLWTNWEPLLKQSTTPPISYLTWFSSLLFSHIGLLPLPWTCQAVSCFFAFACAVLCT